MNTAVSLTNVSFSFLKGSPDFLQAVLDNINSCVLLLNNKMELVAFNNALTTLFPNSRNKDVRYVRCGEALGCAFQVEEATECGKTSKCCDCELRTDALLSYVNNTVINFKKLERPFYNDKHQKINKKIQYSSRLFPFENDKYIILLIESLPMVESQ